ncbi:FliI/YscN family ATPase [Maribius pontilimi]|uniref:FliI/YscN family ATPase n=1 Tax=Palleronia pontilimi TaxID=1964209 RepID=A0A934MCU4_9RHOB|nr:FliI/YscN family ATPase [Palleronia pontilimi]MBJ3763173.1 FliI/YscN family ATPase [Palleronia pontilimi]
MSQIGYANVEARVTSVRVSRAMGRVQAIGGGVVSVRNLSGIAVLGDLVRMDADGHSVGGEVIAIDRDTLTILPDGSIEGLGVGDRVIHMGPATLSPDASWIGRVIDPMGRPLDGAPLLPGTRPRGIDDAPPAPAQRRGLGRRLSTGFCAFNTLLPLVRGQRIGLFAGSGVGKSTLLAGLAQKVEADVIVIALVGERGRELREFIDRVLGPAGMARSVIVAATSDQSASLRRRCAPAAMAVAEHFRDAGRQVLLLTDSVTRFADAHREIALSRGEQASLGGYPPSLVTQITGLCERAGPGLDDTGDITAIFTVLVAGADMDGPVADTLRGVLDGHVVLSRAIAERGRFPAIDLLRSVSRALPYAASDQENTLIAESRRLIGAYEKAELMIQAGLYATGSDRTVDAAIAAWPKLDPFIARTETKTIQDSFVGLAKCLSRRPVVPEPAKAGASEVSD